jgi:hypothetical protein
MCSEGFEAKQLEDATSQATLGVFHDNGSSPK